MLTDIEFGKRVEHMRIKKGISNSDLSFYTGMTLRQLQDVRIRGFVPEDESLDLLAKTLGTTVDWLLNGKKIETINLSKDDCKRFGQNLKKILRFKGISVKDFAQVSGISAPSVTNVTGGKHQPTIQTLTLVANALEMTVEEVLDYDTRPELEALPFGERLRALIFDSGYTEAEVCEKSGVSLTTLKALKSRERFPTEKTQKALSETLGVTPEQLMTGKGVDDYLQTEVLNCLEDYSPKIHIRVADERKAQGLTLEALSKMTGLKINTIENIEYGIVYPSYRSVRLIAQALQVPCSELIVKI